MFDISGGADRPSSMQPSFSYSDFGKLLTYRRQKGKRDDVMKCPPFKVVLTLQGRIATASEISIIGDDKILRLELSSQVFDTFGACVS